MALIGLCVKFGALLGDNVNGEDPHDHTWAILLAVSSLDLIAITYYRANYRIKIACQLNSGVGSGSNLQIAKLLKSKRLIFKIIDWIVTILVTC